MSWSAQQPELFCTALIQHSWSRVWATSICSVQPMMKSKKVCNVPPAWGFREVAEAKPACNPLEK